MPPPVITLSSGTKIPQVGFGIGILGKKGYDKAFYEKIKSAIANGWRHIDAAEAYGTDPELANALEAFPDIPRSEFFITSKVHTSRGIANKDIIGALKQTLKDIRTDYVDLYLIHNPFFPEGSLTIEEAWKQLEEIKKQGLAKEIGISNFRPEDIEKVWKVATIKPAVNQIELNPYLLAAESDTIAASEKYGIQIASYGPLIPIARHKEGPILPLAEELAKKYNVTPAQILLRWQIQHGWIALTSSANPERQKVQLDLDSFQLDKEDVAKIDEAGRTYHFRYFGWGAGKKEYKSVL